MEQGSGLNGRTDAEIEAMAKVSVAEHSAQGFFFGDVNPVEVAEPLARSCGSRAMKGRRDLRATGRRTRVSLW
jgi:hypothetical protein